MTFLLCVISWFLKSWNFEDSLFDLVLLMSRRFEKLVGNWLNFQRKLHQSLLTWSSPDLFKQINWKADFRQHTKSKYQLKGKNYIEREIFIRHLSEAMLCQTTCAIGGGINTTIINCTFSRFQNVTGNLDLLLHCTKIFGVETSFITESTKQRLILDSSIDSFWNLLVALKKLVSISRFRNKTRWIFDTKYVSVNYSHYFRQ